MAKHIIALLSLIVLPSVCFGQSTTRPLIADRMQADATMLKFTNSNNTIDFYWGTSNRMRFTNDAIILGDVAAAPPSAAAIHVRSVNNTAAQQTIRLGSSSYFDIYRDPADGNLYFSGVQSGNNDFVFFGTGTPDVYITNNCFVGGTFSTRLSAIALTADDQSVATAGRSYIQLTSDAAAGSRTFTLTAGAAGQRLVIEFSGANGAELVDTGTTKLASTWTATADDTISLISNGTDWVETGRSAN